MASTAKSLEIKNFEFGSGGRYELYSNYPLSDSGSCREHHRKRVTGLCRAVHGDSLVPLFRRQPVPVGPIAGLRLSGGQYLAKQCIS